MSSHKRLLTAIGSVCLVALMFGGGYALGVSGAPSEHEAAQERAAARREAAAREDLAVARALGVIRRDAAVRGVKRGRKTGTEAGTEAGNKEAADRGAGPTTLDPPKLPTDITLPSTASSTLTDRPAEVTIGNHEVIEGIAWGTWGGEVAEAQATLVGVDCTPSCAEGPQTRDSVTVKAWQPSFNPNGTRYYTKLTLTGPSVERLTLDVDAY